jgi:probable rRNA maturation factor
MAEHPQPSREVTVSNRNRRLRIPRGSVEAIISALDADGRWTVPRGELSVVFTTDAALAKLHDRFLDDPTETDVITFEGDPLCMSAGEICISADRAAAVAAERGQPFPEELALYLVHGYLHLAGYDDLKPELKRAMRRAEAAAMRLLRERGLAADFRMVEPVPRTGRRDGGH